MKGKIQVILVLSIFAGALIAIGALTYANRVQEIDTQLVKTMKVEVVPVQTQVVQRQSLAETLAATGVLNAEQDVVLSSEVSARVTKVTKSLGDACKKGETIVQLDASSYKLAVSQSKASLAQAEVNLEFAEREWERMKRLKNSDVASQSQIDSIEGAYNTAKAAAATARAAVALAVRNLKETRIRCPFNGFIAERMVDPGAMVSPGAPLARVVDTSRLTVTLSVTSDRLARIEVGQEATFEDPAIPTRAYKGQVSRLGVAADPQTRTFPVEVAVDEDERGLHAGQVVQTTLVLRRFEDVIAVPTAAIKTDRDAPYVMTVVDERAKPVSIVPRQQVALQTIVEEGLRVGDAVIVVGHDQLEEGAVVRITAQLPAASPQQPAPAPTAPERAGEPAPKP